MEVDEGDGCDDAMSVCSDSSSSDLLVPFLTKDLDSITFRLAIKKARAKHGLFGTC